MRPARATPSLALRRSLLLLLAALAAWAVLVSGLVPATAGGLGAVHPPTRPHEERSQEESSGITLTSVLPLVAGPGRPVSISGTLDVDRLGLDRSLASADSASGTATPGPTDPATTPPDDSPVVATVELLVGGSPPRTGEEVAEWLTAADAASASDRGDLVTATAVTAGPDPAAERIPFTLVLDDVEDWASAAYGILPVSIDVTRAGESEPAGVLRSFIPYQVRKEYEPLQVTLVAPLTVPRDVALLGEFGEERTAAWDALLGPEGTLRERIDAASDRRVVWALDPALLDPGPAPTEEEPPSAQAEPTTTAPALTPEGTPDGTETPPASPTTGGSPGPEEAETPEGTETPEETEPETAPAREHRLRSEFAADLLEEVDGRRVLLLPRHDADIAALQAEPGGAAAQAVRELLAPSLDGSQAQAALAAAGADVTMTVWPVDGVWSTALDSSFAQLAGVDWTVLASSEGLARFGNGPFVSPAGLTLAPYDSVLSRAAAPAHDGPSTVAAGLTLTAYSLVELNERPGTVRHRVVVLERDGAPTTEVDGLAGVIDAVPWLELTDLGDSAHSGVLGEAGEVGPPPVLTGDRALELLQTVRALPVAASVRADDGADLGSRGSDDLAQLVSLRWREAPEEWSTAYEPIQADVSETFTGLTIPSRDISFLADSGLLRVTIENSLDTGIENAVLDLAVEDPILRVESGPQPVEVGADSRTTVGFDAVAIASGRVDVTATLRAPDGTVLGEPTSFTVRVSPTADWIYWVLGGLAGLVLVIGVVRTVTRRGPRT